MIKFYPKFGLVNIRYSPWGYFDERPQISIQLTTIIAIIGLCFYPSFLWTPFFVWGWGNLYISLPFFLSGKDECDHPDYGYYFYATDSLIPESFWLCYGGDMGKMFELPWALTWYKTSVLKKDSTWEHETREDKNKNFWENKWKDIILYNTYPYIYTLNNGSVQNRIATVHTVQREWRWKWFMYLPWPNFKRRVIEIDFDEGIGEKVGSWKGGCTGCSYDLKKDETPEQCLKRMENERRFN